MSGKSRTGKRGRPAKKGQLSLNRRQRLERELRKAVAAEAVAERKAVAAEAVAAEAKEGALGADSIDAAAQDAFWARERAAEASARLAAASAPSERHAATGRLGAGGYDRRAGAGRGCQRAGAGRGRVVYGWR